jgi:Ca-activated chloride channel family protein
VFRRIGQPLARDVEVQWPAEVEAFPARIPDLYAGQPLLQVARLKGAPGAAPISVKGLLAGSAWQRQIALTQNTDDRGVGQHWARSKLKSLLQGLQRGESREDVRELALPLALRFSLASPFTSFVAVEEEPMRPTRAPLLPGQVPNTRPQGQAPQTFAFAQGATTGPAKLYLGALFAFVALMGFTMTRSEPLS